jgi:hypothetical protein
MPSLHKLRIVPSEGSDPTLHKGRVPDSLLRYMTHRSSGRPSFFPVAKFPKGVVVEKFAWVKCGRPLKAPSGAGRPPSYCSVACRRSAELEVRRLQKHLERLEQERIELGGYHSIDMRDHRGRTLEQGREDNGRAIVELEARLAALLEAESELSALPRPGSCLGSVPAPTMKLASNTLMYHRMQDEPATGWLDGHRALKGHGRDPGIRDLPDVGGQLDAVAHHAVAAPAVDELLVDRAGLTCRSAGAGKPSGFTE